MDSTTQAHLDPSIMTHTQQQGEIPHLGVASPAEIRAAASDSHSALYADDVNKPAPIHPTGATSTSTPTSATSQSVSNSANNAANTASANVAAARDNASATATNAKENAKATANDLSAKATQTKNNVAANVEPAVQGLRARANQLGSQASEVTHQVAEHPVVQNAKQSAEQQVGQFREFLGNFPVVKDLEKRTGVDRVALVAGGVVAYFLLVPLNLFGLALPVTQFLTFVPPTILALDLLERRDTSMRDEDTKTVLAYFVVLGFIQFIESLAPGVLARRIPQYWTVKLIFLAYLIHPQTKGALKIHNSFLKNFVTQSPQSATSAKSTPPTSNPFNSNGASQASSPNYSPRVGTADVTSQYPSQNAPVVPVVPVVISTGTAVPATHTL